MNVLFESIGWVGSLLFIGAYVQISRGAWPARSLRYQVSNGLAALLLVAYSWHKMAYANVFINIVWLAVGATAIIAIMHTLRRRSGATKRRRT
jgi:hypothetical protein